MPYEGFVKGLLDAAGVAPGDEIEVVPSDDRTERGILMEHHAFSAADIVTLKLPSGYNVGVAVTPGSRVTKVAPARVRPAPAREIPTSPGLPAVSVLATGGTIASYVDYRTGAVNPATSPEQLALAAPELFAIANVKTRIVFSMFSEDLQPEHWQKLAHAIKEEFDGGARGVVVTHGTDTMGYTAAALAFFFNKGLPGPVVLVGAQRSSDRPSSDASINLASAVRVAASTNLGEPVVVMHDTTSDGRCAIHRGTRVRKMHTSRRDAFQSINAHPLGWATAAEAVLDEAYRTSEPDVTVEVDDALDEEVSMIQSYPGLWPDHLDKVVLKGVILVGTGLGHVAGRNLDMVRTICSGANADGSPRKRYDGRDAGPGFVVMTSQCLSGRVNMNVYSSGRDLLDAGVIPAEDMLPEVAYIKLMWVLARTQEPAEVAAMMRTPLVGEMGERTPVDVFGHDAVTMPPPGA